MIKKYYPFVILSVIFMIAPVEGSKPAPVNLQVKVRGHMPKQCKVWVNGADSAAVSLPFKGERQHDGTISTTDVPITFRTECNFGEPYSLTITHGEQGLDGYDGFLSHVSLRDAKIGYRIALSDNTSSLKSLNASDLKALQGNIDQKLIIRYDDDPRYAQGTYRGSIQFEIKGS